MGKWAFKNKNEQKIGLGHCHSDGKTIPCKKGCLLKIVTAGVFFFLGQKMRSQRAAVARNFFPKKSAAGKKSGFSPKSNLLESPLFDALSGSFFFFFVKQFLNPSCPDPLFFSQKRKSAAGKKRLFRKTTFCASAKKAPRPQQGPRHPKSTTTGWCLGAGAPCCRRARNLPRRMGARSRDWRF